MAKVAINGMGRIGRAALKIILDSTKLEVVAVNDLMPLDNLVYLLKYDTVYGRYHRQVEMKDGHLVIDGKTIPFLSVKDPAQLINMVGAAARAELQRHGLVEVVWS